MGKQALGDIVQMVTVALIILVIASVRVVEETDGTDFITNGYDGFAWDLYYLHDFVVWSVLPPDVF